MPAATATIRTRHDALQAVFAAEPGNGPLLTGLLHFLNQRDVAQLFAVNRAVAAALRSLLPSNSVWLNLDLQESVRRLCLFVCGRLCDADVRCVECWPSVTAVDVGGCHGLTDEALRAISCTTGNESGERRALQWLSLYWCPQLTDKGVDYLSTNLNCTALLHLSLSGVRHATDASLLSLFDRCVNLTHLDLTRVERMTDDSLVSLGGSCRQLTTLLLYADSQISDIGVRAVARGCHSLRHLDLTGLNLVTDAAITELAAGAPLLQTLTLQWCTAITDDSICALALRCPCLTTLSVHGCRLLTMDGLRALAALPKLLTLDVNGVPAAKRSEVQAAVNQRVQIVRL